MARFLIDQVDPTRSESALAADWFGPLFWEAYASVRRNETEDARISPDYAAQLSRVV